MLARYDCPVCGRTKMHLIREGKPPDEMECVYCGAMAKLSFPRVRTQYKSDGFTKRVEQKGDDTE